MPPVDTRNRRIVHHPHRQTESKPKTQAKPKTEARPKTDNKSSKAEKTNGLGQRIVGGIDSWAAKKAEKNDLNGLRANSVKSFSDLGLALKGSRDVRADRYRLGLIPLTPKLNKQVKTAATRNTPLTRGASGFAAGLGAYQLPASGATAWKDLRSAFKKGATRDDKWKALGSTASFVSLSANTAKGIKELRNARKELRNVTSAFSGVMRNEADKPLHPNGRTDVQLRNTLKRKSHDASHNLAKKYLGAGGDLSKKAFTRTVAKELGDTARHVPAATKNIASKGLKAAKLAKVGGRFVPGANKVIAAADIASAVSAWKDPKASGGKRAAATVTAVGSVLAATDIPVVAQTGAVVSTVASVFTNDAARKATVNAIKNPVSTAKNVAKKLKFW